MSVHSHSTNVHCAVFRNIQVLGLMLLQIHMSTLKQIIYIGLHNNLKIFCSSLYQLLQYPYCKECLHFVLGFSPDSSRQFKLYANFIETESRGEKMTALFSRGNNCTSLLLLNPQEFKEAQKGRRKVENKHGEKHPPNHSSF